jgi:hypothetical protein
VAAISCSVAKVWRRLWKRIGGSPARRSSAREDASAADKSECRQRQAGGSDGLARVALQHGQSARPPTSSVLPGG